MGEKYKNSYILVLFFVSVLLLLLEKVRYLEVVHTASQSVFSPPRASMMRASNTLGETISFSKARGIQDELESLRQENTLLNSLAAKYKALEEENAEFRKLLAADLPLNWGFAPGQTVSVIGDTLYVSIEASVKADTSVIYTFPEGQVLQTGVLVGKTKSVRGQEVEVILPTHTESKIPVIVRDAKTRDRRASGILLGRGGYALLDQVLTSESLAKDDIVLTTSEVGLPPELVIGFIDQVLENREAAAKQAEVRMALNPRELEYVFFVTKY